MPFQSVGFFDQLYSSSALHTFTVCTYVRLTRLDFLFVACDASDIKQTIDIYLAYCYSVWCVAYNSRSSYFTVLLH